MLHQVLPHPDTRRWGVAAGGSRGRGVGVPGKLQRLRRKDASAAAAVGGEQPGLRHLETSGESKGIEANPYLEISVVDPDPYPNPDSMGSLDPYPN
jgi:hypothetical protein